MNQHFKITLAFLLLALSGSVWADAGVDAAQALKSMPLSTMPFGSATSTVGGPQNGVTATTTTAGATVDLACAASGPVTSAPLTAYPEGYGVQCAGTTGGSYTLNVCAPDGNPSDCAQTTATPGTGAFATVAGNVALLTLSACAINGVYTHCTLTFAVNQQYSGTSDTLTAQGQAAANQQAGVADSALSLVNSTGIVDPTTGKSIAKGSSPQQNAAESTYIANNGSSDVACLGKQQLAISGGKAVYTCDGTQSVKLDNAGTCTPDTQCVAYGNQTQNYTQTCEATQTFTQHLCDVVTTATVGYLPGCTPGQTYVSKDQPNSANGVCHVTVTCGAETRNATPPQPDNPPDGTTSGFGAYVNCTCNNGTNCAITYPKFDVNCDSANTCTIDSGGTTGGAPWEVDYTVPGQPLQWIKSNAIVDGCGAYE